MKRACRLYAKIRSIEIEFASGAKPIAFDRNVCRYHNMLCYSMKSDIAADLDVKLAVFQSALYFSASESDLRIFGRLKDDVFQLFFDYAFLLRRKNVTCFFQ